LQFQSVAVTAPKIAEPLQFLDRPYIWEKIKAVPLTVLALVVLFLHGYHPYSQDAAIYVAGIERAINPSLFHVDAVFIDSHTRLSIFSHILAEIALYSHLPVNLLLLLTFIVSVAAYLSAIHLLAMRIFRSELAQWSATSLAAICFTLPAAGTSLLLMDPYLTARSISTPLSLFAILACLNRCWRRLALCLVLTLAVHPLMGLYLAAFVLVLGLLDHRRFQQTTAVCAAGFLIAAAISLLTRHSFVSPAYREAATSRSYYFLSGWRWYEIAGLVIPLMLMTVAAARCRLSSIAGRLSATCVLIGGTALLISACFVQPSHPDFLMRIQVLRAFHTIYVLGIVMLGGFLVSNLWERSLWIGAALMIVAAAGMYAADLQDYPATSHIEWPGSSSANPWEQAFEWIQANTPQNAVFAVDSSAFDTSAASTQGFRAMAERSILVDTKDEGVASLVPGLADEWRKRRDAERGLDRVNDRERIERLRPYEITWILLSAKAITSFSCPYRNSAITVCRLPLNLAAEEASR
jgi:hypothetical protein